METNDGPIREGFYWLYPPSFASIANATNATFAFTLLLSLI
jgi:hypothetical protein